MLGSAVMSEIFYRQGIPTERCLTVIGFPDATAIGVRTAPNLIRPAHIFRYLKQGRLLELRAAVDYFIDREIENGFWQFSCTGNERYSKALDYLARSYAKMAAMLEEEYIFNWLSWDGDNMLASGAIRWVLARERDLPEMGIAVTPISREPSHAWDEPEVRASKLVLLEVRR